MSDQSMIDRVVKALEASLEAGALASGGYIGETENGKVVLDGTVDLKALARSAINAMRDPTEAMLNETRDIYECYPYYVEMIDAALKE